MKYKKIDELNMRIPSDFGIPDLGCKPTPEQAIAAILKHLQMLLAAIEILIEQGAKQ